MSVQVQEYEEFCLTPELLEVLTDSRGRIRLNSARFNLLNDHIREDLGFPTLNDALELGEELFSQWRDLAEFIVLRKEFVGRGEKPDQYLAVKCSKRGNDVYRRRIKTRLGWFDKKMSNKQFFTIQDFEVNKDVFTSLLWITLTCDPKKKKNLIDAWQSLGEDFNRFVSALRRRYGKLEHFRVWESYESGYPHIHAVVLFEEAKFKVFPYWDKENTLTFRIKEKEDLAQLWHSHIDVQAISSLKNVFSYLKKHQEKVILGLSGSIQESEKVVGFDLENIKGLRTLFLCWLFRKRSFSVSGRFQMVLSDLISTLHNSNMEKQVDLMGIVVSEWVYVFLGVFSGGELGIPQYIWSKSLDGDFVIGLLRKRKR